MATASDYLYPGSNVLINKPGIKDPSRLDAFEREASAIRLAELKDNPVKGGYDIEHMQAIHGRIFQDVYDWAGQLRSVSIAKGPTTDRTFFTPVSDLQKGAIDIHKDIKDSNYLRGSEQDAFASKMGDLYKKVNDLHPFREGNGRAAREFLGQLADGAGYTLNYSGVSRQEWNSAAKESARGNLDPIRSVFNEISTSKRAIAFDKLNRDAALAHHPELDGAFKKLFDAQIAGKDVESEKVMLSKQLHLGKIIEGGVTHAESLRIIENAAKARGLTTQAPGNLGTKHAGTVVAQSTHHMLLKVGDSNAILFDCKTLAENLQVGDKLTLQNQVLQRDNIRAVSGSNGLDRVPSSH